MHFLVACCRILDSDDDRLKLFLRVLKLLIRFYDLLERRDLLLRLSRFIESGDQFVGVRYAFTAGLNWLGLFCWNRKSAARLECFFRCFPPAFPFRLGENITDQPFADLLLRRLSVHTFQNVSHRSEGTRLNSS